MKTGWKRSGKSYSGKWILSLLWAGDGGSLDQGGSDKGKEKLIDLLLCIGNRFTIYL